MSKASKHCNQLSKQAQQTGWDMETQEMTLPSLAEVQGPGSGPLALSTHLRGRSRGQLQVARVCLPAEPGQPSPATTPTQFTFLLKDFFKVSILGSVAIATCITWAFLQNIVLYLIEVGCNKLHQNLNEMYFYEFRLILNQLNVHNMALFISERPLFILSPTLK